MYYFLEIQLKQVKIFNKKKSKEIGMYLIYMRLYVAIGTVNANEIVKFEDASETIKLLLLRNNHKLIVAVEMTEKLLGIPEHLSIFNRYKRNLQVEDKANE